MIQYTLTENGTKVTLNGYNAFRGETQVYFAEDGKPINALDTPGLYRAGRPIQIPELGKNVTKNEIMAGGVKGKLRTIPMEDKREHAFTFDCFTALGFWLSKATDVALDYRYSDSGQTTVASGGTKTSSVLTSAADYKKKDWAIVDTKHATYGGFPELAIISKVLGSKVEYEPISQAPSTGATFKKLAGAVTGTNGTDTGIYLPDSVTVEYPIVQIVVASFFAGSNSIFIHHMPRFEVNDGFFNPSGEMATIGITGSPLMCDEIDVTLADGRIEKRPIYGHTYIIPPESPED